jgi:hypothetical protein
LHLNMSSLQLSQRGKSAVRKSTSRNRRPTILRVISHTFLEVLSLTLQKNTREQDTLLNGVLPLYIRHDINKSQSIRATDMPNWSG